MYVCMCMEFLFCWYGCVFLCVCLCRLLPCVFLVSAISISWIWILSLNLWISIVLWISEFLRGCFDFDLVFWLWLTSWIRFDLCENFWMLFYACFFDDMNGWLGLLTPALSGRFNWIATLKFRSNFWVIVLIYVCYDVKLGVWYGFMNSIWIW